MPRYTDDLLMLLRSRPKVTLRYMEQLLSSWSYLQAIPSQGKVLLSGFFIISTIVLLDQSQNVLTSAQVYAIGECLDIGNDIFLK